MIFRTSSVLSVTMDNVPYKGVSVPDRPQSILTDNQLSLLARLSEVCDDMKVEGKKEFARKFQPPRLSKAGFGGPKVNRNIDLELKEKFDNRTKTPIQMFRKSLPCYKMRAEILQKITDNQASLVLRRFCTSVRAFLKV